MPVSSGQATDVVLSATTGGLAQVTYMRYDADRWIPDTNVWPNLQEHHAGPAAHAAIHLTYTRDHPRCTAIRGPGWSAWFVWSLQFGNQIGMITNLQEPM